MLKEFFDSAKHQEKAIFGFSYELALAGNRDDAVSNKAEAIAGARIKK